MKFIIGKKHLNDAIQNVAKAISSRTTIPILSGIKMDLTANGLTLTASDTDISIQCFIPIQQDDQEIITIEQQGSIILPAKIFVEMIRKLPDRYVEIDVNDNFNTTITSGTTELQLMGLDPEEYPILPRIEENNTVSLPVELLKDLIRETSFAVSVNESTPVLMGVQWQFLEEAICCIATDRHRLSRKHIDLTEQTMELTQNIVISGRTLNELFKIVPDDNMLVDIVIANNQILFKFDHILFYSRLLEGAYPDTSKIIPQTYKTELILDRQQFLNAIDRAFSLSREEKTNIVNLRTLDGKEIEISSSLSEQGRITDHITVDELKGDQLTISFNSKYMLDALKAIEHELIYIGFTGAMSPIIIKPHQDDSTLHLILPYRTSH